MLTKETKRRIDTARDILVGQLPLPSDQIELITIALIYKFMDDIDDQSRELGGKATFFVGALRDLGWRKLISNTLTADERVTKFIQAIEAISDPKQAHIPNLFKSIFKNAFLKFRDGQVLKLFLDEINGFSYDHSEELGNAFEYLLDAMGTQGENGQFRTPRNIIEFIVDVVDPQKEDTILDPACGTAGFLISAYKHIMAANTSPKAAEKDPHAGDLLTGAQRDKLTRQVVGYDVTPLMARLSRVNMYLHHFPNPIIHEYDTLTNKNRWGDKYDVILANPPFMSPKGGIRPHDRFAISANRSEVLFVDYIAEHLTPNGRAGVIVPEGIIFQDQRTYKKLRDMLIADYLIGVISLPAGVFVPYTKVKTSVLVLDRSMARRGSPVLFSQVKRIGISMDAARIEEPNSDLPHVVRDYQAFRAGSQTSPLSWTVGREQLLRHSSTLSAAQFKPINAKGQSQWVRLGDVCTIAKGSSSSTKTTPGQYPLIVRGEENLTSDSYQIDGEAVCVPILSLSHGHGQIKRVHYASGKFAVANLLAAVQPKDPAKLDARYLYLTLDRAKDQLAELMEGAVYVTLKIKDLEAFRIPLPPLSEQKELAKSLDTVQALVMKNKRLIAETEKHIQTALDRIWGESPADQVSQTTIIPASQRPVTA